MKRLNSKLTVTMVLLLVCVGTALVLNRAVKSSARPPELRCTYEFARESTSWNPDLWINGQPALHLEGVSTGLWSVTQFVVDGENQVRITGTRNPAVPSAFKDDECRLTFSEMTHKGFRFDLREICRVDIREGDGRETVDETHTFPARVPVRWGWQDADEVRNLPEQDRTAIMARFHQLAGAMQGHDAKAVGSLFSKWRDGPAPRVAGEDPAPEDLSDPWEHNMGLLRGNPLFVAGEEEIKLTAGTKVVMMFCPGTQEQLGGPVRKPLLSADRTVPIGTNQPEGTKWERQRETIVSVLYFTRIRGKWHMLLPDWRL